MRILESAAGLPTWDAAACESVLSQLRQLVPEIRADWDLPAGEGWCHLVFRNELVAAVRAPTLRTRATKLAFLLANSTVADKMRATFRQAEAVTVEVDDFEADVFSVEPEDFAAFAGYALPGRQALDPSHFSANDLIFATT